MAPPIPSSLSTPVFSQSTPNVVNSSVTTTNSPSHSSEGEDENNFRLQNRGLTTHSATTPRASRKPMVNSAFLPCAGENSGSAGAEASNCNRSRRMSDDDGNVVVSSSVKNLVNQYNNATKAGAGQQLQEAHRGHFFPPRPAAKTVDSAASPPNTPRSNLSSNIMREPVSVPSATGHRHALTPRGNDGHHLAVGGGIVSDAADSYANNQEAQAMTPSGLRRNRNAEANPHNRPDSSSKPSLSATPPRYAPRNNPTGVELRSSETMDAPKRTVETIASRSSSPSVIPRNPKDTSSATASPKYRARQQQHLQTQSTQQPPQVPRDNQSVHSQTSGSVPFPPSTADWQWGQRSDPDDQEQALFEQRLCEDFYGVAVRKINQNGKSNLRYVKCCLVDVSEIDGELNGGSSTRSLSSRSRSAFSRLRGDRDRSLDRSEPRDYDAHRNLIRKGKKKVLTWGKKKDVKLPLDRFVCVRKGKTNDRTRRNSSPASRILSIISDDPQHPSLDIEAPTKLDREKFARAFARFLDVPLEGDDNQSVRSQSVRSVEAATISSKGKR